MLRIIDLDIDGSITGDTGVWEVAWVEYPAIEEELMFFGRQQFYKAPERVSSVACQAIKENEKRGNPAATQTGKVRGQQLCNRDEISLETIKRMKSYLERAKVYNTDNWDDNGTISWKLWGGQPGLEWVDSVLKSLENKEEMAEVGERGGIKESDKAPKSDTPNPNPKGEGTAKGDASSTRGAEVTQRVEDILKEKSDDFNERYKDKLGYGVNVGMLKSVYQRGVGAYNVSHSPEVNSAEQWALARVNAFLYLVKNGRPENPKYVGDYDLLPSGHPKKDKMSEEFVSPRAGESKDEYISRCVKYVINEGKSQDEALGKCYGMWEQEFVIGDKVSFDWDETLTDPDSIPLLENELRRASLIYIISARQSVSESMRRFASKYNIPSSRIYATGSNSEKINKIEELGINRHYDNNADVISKLGKKGIQFDYDISSLPPYENYPVSGDPQSMLLKPIIGAVGMSEDCGCMKRDEFNLLGYIDGQPVFSTPEDAELYGSEVMNCQGSHEHTDEDGNVVYMACDTHPEEFSFSMDEYSDEEKEVVELLQYLRRTDIEKFESVIGELRGATLEQVKRRNHKTATPYYLYKRVLSGSPDRDFCTSIEGRYFRRFEIDLLYPLNREFGHKGNPYSKWEYLGGPNCVHAWYRVVAVGRNVQELGAEPGLPGTPMKSRPLQGYYNEETRAASRRAYAISQNMSKQEIELYDELTPIGWIADLPYYDDPILASDASYLLGCGGIYEQMEVEGKTMFQSCSTKMRKDKVEKGEMFRANKERRIIYTPLMIPNILIPRLDDVSGERYFVKFTPEVIEKIQNKFMIEQRLRDTNLEHTDKKFSDAVMVESWIVDGESDKAYSLGYTKDQIPVGTWMGGYKVLDTDEGNEIWDKYIKTGKVRGASVEGNFLLNFSREKTDEYLLEQIINILKEIN